MKCGKCDIEMECKPEEKMQYHCPKCGAEACGRKCEVYSRIVGYYRPVEQWNPGKTEEFKMRKEFSEQTAITVVGSTRFDAMATSSEFLKKNNG
jgi:hypothetical protein